jgi:rhomboid protease GluP
VSAEPSTRWQVRGASRPQARHQLPRWVVGLIVICCLIEAALSICGALGWGLPMQMSHSRFLPNAMTYYVTVPARQLVFAGFAFWSPQVHAGHGLYPGQPLVMFLTYGLLHSGLLHLAMNMLSLAAVGRELNRLISAGQMFLIYAVSQIAAAGLFAVMQPQAGPMVGASGAIFGLAGALVAHAGLVGYRRQRPLGQFWRAVGLMVLLNVVLTVLVPSIAWQAHLGGAIAGVLMGLYTGNRAAPRA